MIEARIGCQRTLDHLKAAGTPLEDYYDLLDGEESRGHWEDAAAVAHFIGDLAVEYETEQLTLDQLKLGFPEFGYWAEELAPLYANLEEEERIVGQLLHIYLLLTFQPASDDPTKRELLLMPRGPLGTQGHSPPDLRPYAICLAKRMIVDAATGHQWRVDKLVERYPRGAAFS